MKQIITIATFLSVMFLLHIGLLAQGIHAREEMKLNQALVQYNLDGDDVVVGIIDRGIDFFHPDFIDENGHTRILFLYDMINPEGASDPDNPYGVGTIFDEEELNAALQTNQFLSMDRYGHGTATSGIAAGNGSAVSNDDFKGVAPGAKLIVVKAVQDYFPPFDGQPGQDGFFNPNYIIIALQFLSDKLNEIGLPGVALMNIGSIGGPTDGSSAMNVAMDAFVEEGYPLVCGVGDDGGNDNHASADIGEGETIEIEIQKGIEGNLRFDLWYSENDRFEVSITKPDNTVLGPFAAPDSPQGSDDHFLDGVNYYHRGADVEFYEATSYRREILIDITSENGIYKISLTGSSINDGGSFHATLNPSRLGNANKFLSYVVPGYSINDYSSAFKVISPGDYVVKNDWIDLGGNTQQFTGQGNPGELWSGSSFGPTHDERPGIDFATCGEVLYAAYSPDTWYSHYPHSLVQGGDGQYGIQNAVSAAAPLTTGLIALMLDMNPNLSAGQVKEILQQTARSDEFTGVVPNNQWGFGKLDAFEALKEVEKTLDIKENQHAERRFVISPNPAKESISVIDKLNAEFLLKQLTISSAAGKLIKKTEVIGPLEKISVNDLKPGVYLLGVEWNGFKYYSKFIKE